MTIDQAIKRLRNRAGWWEGDDNARIVLQMLVSSQARELAQARDDAVAAAHLAVDKNKELGK